MKLIFATIALMVACSSAASIVDSSLNTFWGEFKLQHQKKYSLTDEPIKRQIWEENLKKINQHNLEHSLGKHTYTLKMNKYGDLTHQQFVKLMNTFKQSSKPISGSRFLNASNVEIPTSVDWRKSGYVTPIKDQGQCGSCWAFSTVASLEGQHFKATGKLVSLSEQNLMDCSVSFGNNGCEGGLMDQGFAYIKANGGIDTEASYPYEAVDADCRFNKANVGATCTGYVDVKSGDESDLTNAIATVGPISVAIDASQDSFQFYSSGVYSDPNCSSFQLDHGVTAVGYGTDSSSQDYYIVKNSWGTSWGDNGYINMARNDDNMCGIATAASYPLV